MFSGKELSRLGNSGWFSSSRDRRRPWVLLFPAVTSLFSGPERADGAVLPEGEVFALFVRAAHVAGAAATDLTPCSAKKSLICSWIFGFVATSVATHRLRIGSAPGDVITEAAILVVVTSSGP